MAEIEKVNDLTVLDDKLNMLSSPISSYEVIASSDFGKQYANLVAYIKYFDELKKSIDAQLKTVMEEEYFNTGNQSVDTDSCKITFVPGSMKETFDSKKFKEEHPDLYKEYIKVSSTAASLRTTLKDKVSGD